MSLQSIIIASVIAAILGVAAVSNMWPSVEKAKVTTMTSYLKEIKVYLLTQAENGFADLDKLNENGDGNKADYLADIINSGAISKVPRNVFDDPDNLVFELRSLVEEGQKRVFYVHYETPSEHDREIIDEAVNKLNFEVANAG